MVSVVPRPASLSMETVPPHPSMSLRLMARPSPLPLVRVEKCGSNTRERVSGAIPCPSSRTQTVVNLAVGVTVTVTDPAGKIVPAWRVFWTVFGTSNQLLAALTLLGLTTWLRRSGRGWRFVAFPCAFMMGMTLWALGILLKGWVAKFRAGGPLLEPVGIASLLLMILALVLLAEGLRALKAPASPLSTR